MSNGWYPCRRLVLTFTIQFSPLQETTQTPMNLPRKAAQVASLPRLHCRTLSPASRGHTCGDAGPDSGSGAASPAAAAQAADPAATAPGVLDVKDFTAWTPGTWELLPWDEIDFPKDT